MTPKEKQARPRYTEKKNLTYFWVQKALKNLPEPEPKFAKLNPAVRLAALVYDVAPNLLDNSEKTNYKRYATPGVKGHSMDLVSLKRFVERARNLGLLPKSGIRYSSETILGARDPNKRMDDLLSLPGDFYEKKNNLLNALSEYIEAFKEAERLGVLLVELESDTNSETYDSVLDVFVGNNANLDHVKSAMESVDKHYLVTA